MGRILCKSHGSRVIRLACAHVAPGDAGAVGLSLEDDVEFTACAACVARFAPDGRNVPLDREERALGGARPWCPECWREAEEAALER